MSLDIARQSPGGSTAETDAELLGECTLREGVK